MSEFLKPAVSEPMLSDEYCSLHTRHQGCNAHNRKTGQSMPLYMVNVLPNKNFEEIYIIKEIYYISVTIKNFKSYQRVKQCHRCQGCGHASEIFTPKYANCGADHLTTNCEHKGRITPKYANCGQARRATYRGCIKNPYHLENNNKRNNNKNNSFKNSVRESPKKPNFSVKFLRTLMFNYTKKSHNKKTILNPIKTLLT